MATTIDLSPEFEKRLNLLASEIGRSKEYFRREIIERGMEAIEDYYLSKEVLKRVRSENERVCTSAELERAWLGVLNATPRFRKTLRQVHSTRAFPVPTWARLATSFHLRQYLIHQPPDHRAILVKVLEFHPIVVEIGVARLGDLEVRENAAVATLFHQLLCGVVTLRVLSVAPAPALAERFQCVAGCAPELFRGLQQVAGHHLVVGLIE